MVVAKFFLHGLWRVFVLVATLGLLELADGFVALDAKGEPGLHPALEAPQAIGEGIGIVFVFEEGIEAGLVGACDHHHVFS